MIENIKSLKIRTITEEDIEMDNLDHILVEVYDENKLHTVANPAEPYVSDTYSTRGPQLEAIMSEANTKFIVGQISEDEWKAQRDRWLQQGGQKVIDELNKAYEEDDSVQK